METLLAACLSRYGYIYQPGFQEIISRYLTLERLYLEWQNNPNSISQNLRGKCNAAWANVNLESMKMNLETNDIRCVTVRDPDYPPLLGEIPWPPYALYLQGDNELFRQTLVSIVGTRKNSLYGKRCVESLVSGLAGTPCVTVSGLAIGIDALVHHASIEVNVPTVAVLAGGLDKYQPTTNARLGRRIIAEGGTIISEYPPGVVPEKHHFLARNRIIAGLSPLTIIIEGELKSGSLVTGRDALAYGREVGIVPGDIFSPNSKGPHSLLYDGAWPITSSADILEILGLLDSSHLSPVAITGVFKDMLHKPTSIDSLIERTELSLSDIQTQLTEMEIQGIVARNELGEYFFK